MVADPTSWKTAPVSVEAAIRCPAAPEELHRVHEAVAGFWPGVAPQPAEEWKLRFELAVAEIAANIVEHARPPAMNLRLSLCTGRVTAEFTDRGRRFEASPRPGMAGEDAERGRGIGLARIVLDELHYERDGGLNRWRLVKCL